MARPQNVTAGYDPQRDAAQLVERFPQLVKLAGRFDGGATAVLSIAGQLASARHDATPENVLAHAARRGMLRDA